MFAHCSLEYVLILHVPVSLCCSVFYFFFLLLFHALYFCWIVIKWLVGQLNFNNVSLDSNNLKLSVLTGLMQKVIISLCSGTVKNPLESCVKRCLPTVKAIHRHCSFMLLAAVGCTNFALYAWAKLTVYTWLWEKMKDLFLRAPAASALSHWWLWPDRIAISVSPLALLFDQWALLSCSGIPCTLQPQLVSLDLRSFLELVLSSDAVSSGLYQRLFLSLTSSEGPPGIRAHSQRFRFCFLWPPKVSADALKWLEFIYLASSWAAGGGSLGFLCLHPPLLSQDVPSSFT